MTVVLLRPTFTKEQRDQLLGDLALAEGHDSVEDMFSAAVTDSIAPAICTECGATAGLEPDQDAGWCHSCGRSRMVSCLILGDLI
jgi:hypothetical protein